MIRSQLQKLKSFGLCNVDSNVDAAVANAVASSLSVDSVDNKNKFSSHLNVQLSAA